MLEPWVARSLDPRLAALLDQGREEAWGSG